MSQRHIHLLCAFILAIPLSYALVSTPAVGAQDDNDGSAPAQKSDAEKNADEADDPKVHIYPDQELGEETPGNNNVEAKPISPKEKAKLERRAGEKTAGAPSGAAVVLGMHIQESDYERAKIIKVALATPAFEAGIREGDEIVSFDGFKAKTYREWIDGIRKLTTKAPDGASVPIVLMRGGKQLSLRLRVPVDHTVLPRENVTLNQPLAPGQAPPTTVVAGAQPVVPNGRGGGDNILINDQFGNNFDNGTGPATERAIAEIFKLNVPQPNDAKANTSGFNRINSGARGQAVANAKASAAAAGGARVGLAGFRNDANGMFVMLDVGGLQPGNYTVGIADPSVVAMNGGPTPNTTNTPPTNPRIGARTSTPGNPRIAPPQPGSNLVPAATPPNGAVRPAAGAAEPQGRLAPPANNEVRIPRTVLAQVADAPGTSGTATTTNGATPNGTRPPDAVAPNPNAAPGANQPVGEAALNAPPVGQPLIDSANQPANTAADASANANVGAAGTGPTIQIGTFTVDQSGTGRLQQVVESVRVQDVIGQAIAIYGESIPANTALPANLDPSAEPTSVRQPATSAAVNAGVGNTKAADSPAEAQRSPIAPATANGAGSNMPVAAGLIRSLSDHPPGTTGTTTNATPTDPSLPAPESPVPTNNLAPATPNQ